MIITIDTNIIVQAFEEEEPDHRLVIGLVIKGKHKLGCDVNEGGIILQQYKKNIRKNTLGYSKWIKRLYQLNAICFQSKYDISNKHKTRLSRLQCHEPSDLVFIGVAFHSDKILISEDSDVGKGPKGHIPPHCDALSYLTKEMELTILDAEEACQYFDKA